MRIQNTDRLPTLVAELLALVSCFLAASTAPAAPLRRFNAINRGRADQLG